MLGPFLFGVYLGGMIPILVGYMDSLKHAPEQTEPVESLVLTLIVWPIAPFLHREE